MTRAEIRPVRLPPGETETAKRALERVRDYLDTHRDRAQVSVTVEDCDREPLVLPREVVELLAASLAHLGAGRGVLIVPSDVELTTQQAADMLNVSRPFLVGLLNAGEIEYRIVGTHRRVAASSVMEYKRRDGQRHRAAADELARLGQETGPI
ncbi:helix-turn-helix domain-containing protein [Streptomyces sp. NPDC058548]|uniref:helix-turn-helix domain-containing protein n=1 Tax=Streptomyces sp. NPDC058548 TaxID=3346545 RepID=UPI00365C0C8A